MWFVDRVGELLDPKESGLTLYMCADGYDWSVWCVKYVPGSYREEDK